VCSASFRGCESVTRYLDRVDLIYASDAVVVGRVEQAEDTPTLGIYRIRLLRTLKNSSAPLPTIFEVKRKTQFFEPTNDPVGTPVFLKEGTISMMTLRIIPDSSEVSSRTYELLYGAACDNSTSEKI